MSLNRRTKRVERLHYDEGLIKTEFTRLVENMYFVLLLPCPLYVSCVFTHLCHLLIEFQSFCTWFRNSRKDLMTIYRTCNDKNRRRYNLAFWASEESSYARPLEVFFLKSINILKLKTTDS